MQQIGKTPVRFLTFPGEPHSFKKIAHQRRKVEEDEVWFDRYLFGKAPAGDTVVKVGTPLGGLLQRAKAACVKGGFGQEEKGTLVPETVRFEGLEVGRFEVTRAQFAAFDPKIAADPTGANLPVTGLGFEQAKAFAAWLAATTGRAFRLPTEEEARKLAKAAGEGGNTLDRWAGYTPNPEDRAHILEAIKTLPGEAPLLLTVGSLPGTGEDPVFDLDGNAAEWATARDGTALAVGPSADLASDSRSQAKPGSAYTGLRVVVGAAPPQEGIAEPPRSR